MIKYLTFIFVMTLTVSATVSAQHYHVDKSGNDADKGTLEFPLLTIQAAANLARPGDTITVHEGVYRERVTPLRGGTSPEDRIVYQAADGERVEIRGSAEIKSWINFKGTVWKATIPNSLFNDYNPYTDLIRGDWFKDNGRIHHTGEVYLNGQSLWEMELFEKVLHPMPAANNPDTVGSTYTWYCESDKAYTYIYANFHGADPNKESVEINVRPTCFYPDTTGIDYITVKGFYLSQAATQWAPPTAEQIGLIGTNWSKGWIIEHNVIRNSKCAGITLGKYGDEFDNTSESSAEGYVETIKRALVRGWSQDSIGSHVVRNNSISACGQAGICGSLGGVFSIIQDNDIFDIWTKRQFAGPEPAGIKIHGSIDMLIKGNRVRNTGRGIWLDWMAQGTRVTANLCYENDFQDIYSEVNHGPYLVDNNILLSLCSVWDMSQGGAYVHNLMAGRLNLSPHSRVTPYHHPHSTKVAGYHEILGGDDRFVNNIFVAGSENNTDQPNPQLGTRSVYGGEYFGLKAYDKAALPVRSEGNAYLNGALPASIDSLHLELKYDPALKVTEEAGESFLSFFFDQELVMMENEPVTKELLGETKISALPFENPDGSAVHIEKDFLGNPRTAKNPTVGPFELGKGGFIRIRVW